ncbi:MAG: protein kinase, partial [Gemmataceae bacterium]|nr:protein kinase [Gemmataceae bacterium]
MGVVQNMCALALQQLAGEGIPTVVSLLTGHLSNRGQMVVQALQVANDRAWRAFEIALAGESWWEHLKSYLRPREDQAFAQQIRVFLDGLPLDDVLAGQQAEVRLWCLAELRQARQKNILTGGSLSSGELVKQVGQLSSTAPQTLLAAQWRTLSGLGVDLRQAGYAWLAWLVEQRPRSGHPLLVLAVRHFFRREVETNPELARGLLFTGLEELSQSQRVGLQRLNDALIQQGERVTTLLGEVLQVTRKTHDEVVAAHGTVREVQAAVAEQARQLEELRGAIHQAIRHNELGQSQLGPRDSFSIRSDTERQLVKQLLERFRHLPPEEQRQAPDLLVSLGVLVAAAGDVATGQRILGEAAEGFAEPRAKADAHFSAYRAALEARDWKGALEQLAKALRFEAPRLAPFPLARYQPLRILGAGGFGVAFLCRHKHMGNLQVVKALFQEELERSVDSVFTEASLLSQLDDPAFVRMTDCGYVSASTKSRPYLVMEYFDGQSLEEHVKENGCLAPADLKQV